MSPTVAKKVKTDTCSLEDDAKACYDERVIFAMEVSREYFWPAELAHREAVQRECCTHDWWRLFCS